MNRAMLFSSIIQDPSVFDTEHSVATTAINNPNHRMHFGFNIGYIVNPEHVGRPT